MSDFLSQDWLDSWRLLMADIDDADSGPRPSVRVAIVVPGAPGGEVTVGMVLLDGGVVEAGLAPSGEPEVSFTAPLPLAVEIVRGHVSASAAFMQGRLKTAGDAGKVLDVLAWSHRSSRVSALAKLVADTTFPSTG